MLGFDRRVLTCQTTAQGMNGLAAPKTGSAVRQSASIGGMTMVMLSAAWFCLCS